MARDFKKRDFIHVFGYFKERTKEDKLFKNSIVKSLNKIENTNVNNNEEK